MECLLADLQALVECESPSSDLSAVARSADVLARLGTTRLGVAPQRVVVDGCTHVIWRFGGPSRVLLLGHHDTVWPVGSLATLPFTVSGDVLRGPGCFDMKAGLAMALHALASLPDRAGLTFLVTGDEELGSPTSRALIEEEARSAEAVLVLEASADGGALKVARKGVSLYDVTVRGRAAHAGLEPELGVNATIELAHQVLAVASLGDAAAGTTVTPTRARAGITGNTVPSSGSFSVDVRVRSAQEQDRVHAAMQALTPALGDATLDVAGGPNRPPLPVSASADLLEVARAAARRLGLPEPTTASVGGASDGNLAAGVGTPTLDGLGAVGGGAHAQDEHVIVSQLAPRTALLAAVASDLLARPRDTSRPTTRCKDR